MERADYQKNAVPTPAFSPEIMERLFYWTRDRVAEIVAKISKTDPGEICDVGKTPVLGAFVSFKKRGRLRSCMGCMSEGMFLAKALMSAAYSAATSDPRFPPIAPEEFYDLDLEIWVLGALREIQECGEKRRLAVKIGRDGLQIQANGRRGLLLPGVALEQNWSVEQFLEGVCNKAGLPRSAWKNDDVRLWTFEGVSFKKPFVWNASKNPALKILISSPEIKTEPANSHPTYSFAPGTLQWNVAVPRKTLQEDVAQLVRPAAVAGVFYPKTREEQVAMLDRFDNENGAPKTRCFASAALVPHAGWVYSGRLAAKTFAMIEKPDTILVIAPKHRREGANFAVMPYGSWAYGAGRLQNDLDLVERLVKIIPTLVKDPVAHRAEHAIEVQLPFIARYFPKSKVVGVVIGGGAKAELKDDSEVLANLLDELERKGKKVLPLISSDMNHYLTDAATRNIDKLALDALDSLDPENLIDVVRRNNITICGILPAFLTLSALRKRNALKKAIKVGYATSADVSGNLERVVGYAGYIFQ